MTVLTMPIAFSLLPSFSIASSTALCVVLATPDQSLRTSSNPFILILPLRERSAYFFLAPAPPVAVRFPTNTPLV